jgi:hypothetical protein
LITTIYAIVHKTKRLAYVGMTVRPIKARYQQHLRDAAAGRSHKSLAEALRHEPDGFDLIECESSETASEARWMKVFVDDGYTLLNDTGGNAKAAKKRTRGPDVSVAKFVSTPEHLARYHSWLRELMDSRTWVPKPEDVVHDTFRNPSLKSL